MSKTEENLKAAFAGESQARNKYTYFAKVARKEGYHYIAKIFEALRPDVVGTQEANYRQLLELAELLPDYEFIGEGNLGPHMAHSESNWYCATFYRRRSLTVSVTLLSQAADKRVRARCVESSESSGRDRSTSLCTMPCWSCNIAARTPPGL